MTVATLLLALAIPLQPMTPQPPQTLAALRDKYRPLLIFAPNDDPRLARQVQMLTAHRADLVERQIVLVPFLHKHAGAWDREIEVSLLGEEDIVRRRFQVPSGDFTAILIGKDGGEKFRSNIPITMQQLSQIIDAMPMRRQEMKTRERY